MAAATDAEGEPWLSGSSCLARFASSPELCSHRTPRCHLNGPFCPRHNHDSGAQGARCGFYGEPDHTVGEPHPSMAYRNSGNESFWCRADLGASTPTSGSSDGGDDIGLVGLVIGLAVVVAVMAVVIVVLTRRTRWQQQQQHDGAASPRGIHAGDGNWTTASAYVYADAPHRNGSDDGPERRKSYQAQGHGGDQDPPLPPSIPTPLYAEPTAVGDTLAPGAALSATTFAPFYNASAASPNVDTGAGVGESGGTPAYASVDYGQMNSGTPTYAAMPSPAAGTDASYDKFELAAPGHAGYEQVNHPAVDPATAAASGPPGNPHDGNPLAFYSSAAPPQADRSPPASPRVPTRFDGLAADYDAFGQVTAVGPEPNYAEPEWIQPSAPSSPLDYGEVRQLRHRVSRAFISSRPPRHTPCAPCPALGGHACRMLVGACDLMLCPTPSAGGRFLPGRRAA